MNTIELEMMKGMVSILNEAAATYNAGSSIMTNEQYDTRLADLKQFEEETGFIFFNSPTCKTHVKSLVKTKESISYNFEKCHDVESIIDFARQYEMLVYPNLIGANVRIDYANGIMIELEIDNKNVNLNKVNNIPYKIEKKERYIVMGVITSDSKLYVIESIKPWGKLKDGLMEAQGLGFDIVPHWINANTVNALNPKNLQSNIDYVFEYARENEYSFDGIVFRLNDDKFQNGIIYKREGNS